MSALLPSTAPHFSLVPSMNYPLIALRVISKFSDVRDIAIYRRCYPRNPLVVFPYTV
jgi:hypothetical protein